MPLLPPFSHSHSPSSSFGSSHIHGWCIHYVHYERECAVGVRRCSKNQAYLQYKQESVVPVRNIISKNENVQYGQGIS